MNLLDFIKYSLQSKTDIVIDIVGAPHEFISGLRDEVIKKIEDNFDKYKDLSLVTLIPLGWYSIQIIAID